MAGALPAQVAWPACSEPATAVVIGVTRHGMLFSLPPGPAPEDFLYAAFQVGGADLRVVGRVRWSMPTPVSVTLTHR